MSLARVRHPKLPKTFRTVLKSEVSRAFGLWIAAAVVCLVMSFAWMSAHYDPNRPALAAAKHDTASADTTSAP